MKGTEGKLEKWDLGSGILGNHKKGGIEIGFELSKKGFSKGIPRNP